MKPQAFKTKRRSIEEWATVRAEKAVLVAGCDNSGAELQKGRYFLRITRRLRRGRSLRPRRGSGSVGAITFAFSLL